MKYLVTISCLVAAVSAAGHMATGYGSNGMMNLWGMGQNNWMNGPSQQSGSLVNQHQIMTMLQSLAHAVQGIAEHRQDHRDDDDHGRGGNNPMIGNLGGSSEVMSLIVGLLLASMDQPRGGHQDQDHNQVQDHLMDLLGQGHQMGDIQSLLSMRMRDDLAKMMMDHMDYMETKKYFHASTLSLCLMVRAKAYMEMNNTVSMIKDLSDSDLKSIGEREKNAFEMMSEDKLLHHIMALADMTDMAFEKNFYEVAAVTCKYNWKYMQMRRKVDGKDDDDDDKDWMKMMMVMSKLMEMKEDGMMGSHESGNGEESGDQSGTESGDQSGTESGDQSGTESGDGSGST